MNRQLILYTKKESILTNVVNFLFKLSILIAFGISVNNLDLSDQLITILTKCLLFITILYCLARSETLSYSKIAKTRYSNFMKSVTFGLFILPAFILFLIPIGLEIFIGVIVLTLGILVLVSIARTFNNYLFTAKHKSAIFFLTISGNALLFLLLILLGQNLNYSINFQFALDINLINTFCFALLFVSTVSFFIVIIIIYSLIRNRVPFPSLKYNFILPSDQINPVRELTDNISIVIQSIVITIKELRIYIYKTFVEFKSEFVAITPTFTSIFLSFILYLGTILISFVIGLISPVVIKYLKGSDLAIIPLGILILIELVCVNLFRIISVYNFTKKQSDNTKPTTSDVLFEGTFSCVWFIFRSIFYVFASGSIIFAIKHLFPIVGFDRMFATVGAFIVLISILIVNSRTKPYDNTDTDYQSGYGFVFWKWTFGTDNYFALRFVITILMIFIGINLSIYNLKTVTQKIDNPRNIRKIDKSLVTVDSPKAANSYATKSAAIDTVSTGTNHRNFDTIINLNEIKFIGNTDSAKERLKTIKNTIKSSSLFRVETYNEEYKMISKRILNGLPNINTIRFFDLNDERKANGIKNILISQGYIANTITVENMISKMTTTIPDYIEIWSVDNNMQSIITLNEVKLVLCNNNSFDEIKKIQSTVENNSSIKVHLFSKNSNVIPKKAIDRLSKNITIRFFYRGDAKKAECLKSLLSIQSNNFGPIAVENMIPKFTKTYPGYIEIWVK